MYQKQLGHKINSYGMDHTKAVILFPWIWDLEYRYKSSLKIIQLNKSSVFVRDPTFGSMILLVPKSWIQDLLTCSIFPSPKSTYSYI